MVKGLVCRCANVKVRGRYACTHDLRVNVGVVHIQEWWLGHELERCRLLKCRLGRWQRAAWS